MSETEARFMDPDEVIILASPQPPIRAKRIKYFDDPVFAAMMGAQKGSAHPFPPAPKVTGSDRLGSRTMRSDKPKAAPDEPLTAATEMAQASANAVLKDRPTQTHEPKDEAEKPKAVRPAAKKKSTRRVVKLPIVNNPNTVFVTPPEELDKDDRVPVEWGNLLS